ncbi:MAG: putative CMGC/CLK protein kinase [Streblomastix strix]|uniref:Putative CMGC/CLK protein kinase n=1 Tax=Streblomastix strix TaxID=222440 RepID=A0A5J4VJQ1_9EUKA|nr:MAG: putative CMGC/CLK protein kinase [Streblomastix strix]
MYFPRGMNIRLIDFGSAVNNTRPRTSLVCTRQYRPPEVIMGLPWSASVDMWSAGCILLELWTGETLFRTHSTREHLQLIEYITQRRIPQLMIEQTKGCVYIRDVVSGDGGGM